MMSFFVNYLLEIKVEDLQKDDEIELLVKTSKEIWLRSASQMYTEQSLGMKTQAETVIFVDEISALLREILKAQVWSVH
jgi:hypothetical protein